MAVVGTAFNMLMTVITAYPLSIPAIATLTLFYAVESSLKRGLEFLIASVDEDGTVLHASGGTPVMRDRDEYNRIPCVMSYYGQGMAMLALTEADRG